MRARSQMAGMSAGQPPRCTTDMALVRGVINGAMVAAVMAPESGSTSANTGLAPSRTALEAVAMKVRGVVINSSPWLRPMAR